MCRDLTLYVVGIGLFVNIELTAKSSIFTRGHRAREVPLSIERERIPSDDTAAICVSRILIWSQNGF